MALIRLMLVDDHQLVHEAVKTVLSTQSDIILVANGTTGQQAIDLCREHQPDVILMDVVMPVMNGPEATRIIHGCYPDIRILVLSNLDDDDTVHQMIQYGASGYILKSSLLADLISTVQTVYLGNMVVANPLASKLLNSFEPMNPQLDFGLTPREQEVLRLIAEGQSMNEMAHVLFVSPSTVKFHINNILQKMQVTTRAEAIVLAAKNNLI